VEAAVHPRPPRRTAARRGGLRRGAVVAGALALLVGGTVAPAAAAPPGPSGGVPCQEGSPAAPTCLSGVLADGTPFEFVVPAGWNGTVVVALDFVGPGPTEPLTQRLLAEGVARGGTTRTVTGWDIASAVANQAEALARFEQAYGPARHAVASGTSMGGFVSAGAAQEHPDVFDGAVPMCGGLGGSVAQWDQKLDTVFVLEELVAPGLPVLQVDDVPTAQQAWVQALTAAQQTPEGRARIALAAAIGQLPTWGVRPDGTQPPLPGKRDLAGQQEGAFLALAGGPLPYIGQAMSSRRALTLQAGGNPSTNVGVDYARQLQSADPQTRQLVRDLYRQAGLDLDADLGALAAAPRIAADPAARERFAEGIVFDGQLEVPVLTMSPIGDQISTVAQQQYYESVVRRAGSAPLLRQTYTQTVGHCTFSAAEQQAAIDVLVQRLDEGHWPATSAPAMNRRAAALGADPAPRFVPFTPPRFNRPLV
jgi:pimeloyl-ACP methyl ester carboxylesterase